MDKIKGRVIIEEATINFNGGNILIVNTDTKGNVMTDDGQIMRSIIKTPLSKESVKEIFSIIENEVKKNLK